MSGGIRVRQVIDPMPVQRGPAPLPSLEDLSTAWDNHAEAKSALRRAEARLEEAGSFCNTSYNTSSQDPRGILSPSYMYKHHLAGMEDRGQVRVPVDRVPSLEVGSRQRGPVSSSRYSRANYGKGKTRKRVTIVDNYDADQAPLDILSPPRNERSRLIGAGSLDPSPSRAIDSAQIQRLEGQLKSLSKSLKSSARESDKTRPQWNSYDDRILESNWGSISPSRPKSYDQSTFASALSPSSQDILSRGSASMSVDNSTAIRVLNDLPQRQHPEEERNRTHRNYEYREEYVSAYERLYGSQPGEMLQDRKDAFPNQDTESELRQKDAVLQRLRANRKMMAAGSASDHMERLREKVEQQKAAVAGKQPIGDRLRHREGDPVILQDPDSKDPVMAGLSVATGKSTVRKVAAAPAAPAYKGFSEVETRFQLPDGKVVTEDNLTRKTSQKSRAQKNKPTDLGAGKTATDLAERALQPSMALQKQNRPEQPPKPSRTVRKVHKVSKPLEKRPKRPDRSKDIISTTAWREGQKTVLKILGPPPEKPKPSAKAQAPHSPPTHDTEDPPSSKSVDQVININERTKDQISDAELSDHPLPTEAVDPQGKDYNRHPSPSPDLDKLPSEAKNVLEDLRLDVSSSDEEKPHQDAKKPPKIPKKKKPARQDPELILPAERIRHYDTDNVRKYMAKQKAERRRKLLEEKKERKLAQERKQEQLRELSKKQKESVRMSQRNRNAANSQLGETFSKNAPEEVIGDQINVLDQLPRHHPFRQDGKKIDVTSSDKENKNIWSTSSSDSSTPSSLPSDPPHSPSDPAPPSNEADNQPPRQASPIGVVVTQMAGGMPEMGQSSALQDEPHRRAEVTQMNGDFVAKPLPPSSSASVPPEISSAPRSKADRIQALKATAAALQGKIDNEVKKLTGDVTPQAVTSPGEYDRWAYPTGTRTAAPARTVRFSGSAVESPVWEDDSPERITRHQRIVGNDRDHRVFTGSLPGTGSLSAQAQLAADITEQDDAATRIQAAYRGHSVRQKLDNWHVTSGQGVGSTLPDPSHQLSDVGRSSPPRKRSESASDDSISEGSLPDSAADDRDYMPTFKSLPTKHSHVYQPPRSTGHESHHVKDSSPLARPVSLQARGTDDWKESLTDGLSVINIFTRKYQNANRAILYGQLPGGDQSQPQKNSVIGYSYNDDFTGSASTSPGSSKSKQDEDEPYSADFTISSKSKSKSKSTPSSSKSSHKRSSRSQRSEFTDQSQSRKAEDNTLDIPSPTSSLGSSCDDSANRKRVLRTPSPKASLSAHRSSSGGRTPPSLPSPTASHGSKVPSSPDSMASGSSIPQSPATENHSGQGLVAIAKSPSSSQSKSSSGRSQSKSIKVKSSSSRSSDSRARSSVSSRSPHSRDQQSQFRPVKSSSSVDIASDQGLERPLPRSVHDVRSSTASKPPLPGQYSPAALSLKMASELNLLESLEESVRQLSEMERTRHVSLAQQESVSLARVLQARQRDHEREIQLLSLKARQEVEEANKQLEVVRQRAVETASDAERVLAQARRDASDAASENTRRLIESQAEAARMTAEAAKQLAEAQRLPAQPPAPSFDAGKLASDTATAATSAAVTAALEQQRLQQIEFLKEMKDSLRPPPAAAAVAHTRTLGVGDLTASSSRQPSQQSYSSSQSSYNGSSSRTDASHSSKQDYTDDFTESPTKSHRSANSINSGTIPEASSLSSVSDQTRTVRRAKSPMSSESIHTASSVPTGQDNSALSIATESGLSPVKSDYPSPGRQSNSSIQTASSFNGESAAKSPSIVEDISDGQQPSYTTSPSSSRTKMSSSLTPSSTSTPIRDKQEKSKPSAAKYDTHQPQTGSFPLGMDDSFGRLSAEMLRQQLRDEEVRAQQQGALFKLREKTLLEKAKVELEWLEHEKRKHKENGDAQALQAARRKQQALVAKVRQEQDEMRRLRAAQKAASHERQLLLFQQQEILRMRKATEAVKDHMKDLSNISITSSIGGALSDDQASLGSPESSPGLPEVLSDSVDGPLSSLKSGQRDDSQQGVGSGDEKEGGAKTAAEKQAQVMLKLKRMQQPLNMKYLTKREQQLTKRRRNAEELLAWQRRLDEEESQIVTMEREAMRRLDSGKAAKPRPPMKALPLPPATPRDDSAHEESPSRVASDTVTDTASPSQGGGGTDRSGRRESGSSIGEDISQGSSVPEEVISDASPKTSTPRRATASSISNDDTLKHTDSVPEEYASESFETADRTLTPTRSAAMGPPRSSQYSTPSSLESFKAPLSPHRRIMESESGSESEKSFSQTVSEIASDQSDIEGRVKALESELRKRKMEAEKLRRQQKRMQREKLKAQEASLKKQLESYDKLIEKTKAELKIESDSAAKMTSVTVKPQIKQFRGTESQRLKDRSHARSLRQRTASESSREGGTELGSMRKQRSVSEGSMSSRSSYDDEGALAKDPSYTSSFNSVFTPPTTPRLIEDATPPPPKSLSPSPSGKLERSDLSASISEEVQDRTSSTTSDEDSQRAVTVHKTNKLEESPSQRRESRQSEELEGHQDSSVLSEVSEDIPSAYSSVSAASDASLKESPRIDTESGSQRTSPHEKSPAEAEIAEREAKDQRSEQSDASDVPEEVLSAASSVSQESVRSFSKTFVLEEKEHSPKESKKVEEEATETSQKLSPVHVAGYSADELSQKSEPSYSYSSSIRSSHRASYSDDFFESSVSVGFKGKESHSDTDDDISEHLSVMSEPSEPSVGNSRQLGFTPSTDKLKDVLDDTPEAAPEVTISEKDLSEENNKSEVNEDDDRTPVASPHEEQLGISQDFTGYEVGDRVIVNGEKKGTLLFKGLTHFAPGMWGGVELDLQQGTNDGSLDGHVYFHCKASHGIFVPADRLEHIPAEPSEAEAEEEPESSIREDFSSVASEVSEASQRRPATLPGLRGKEADHKPQLSPMSSLSSKTPSESIKPLALVLKSEATDDDSIAEDLSEPVTDDAALAALIHSAAAAVESFHEDDIDEIFSPGMDMTPRGAPEPEVPVQEREQLVDSITDHLTSVIVKDSVKAITKVAEKHSSKGDQIEVPGEAKTSLRSTSTEKPSSSLLEMLIHDDDAQTPKIQEKAEEKANQKVAIKRKIDSTTQTLLNEAISEIISLRNKRVRRTSGEPVPSDKNEPASEIRRTSLPEVESPETPCASPFVRNATPYTPDSESPIQHEDTTLDDDIFINRVKVETNNVDLKDQDQLPVARPGSPVFGESSGINPEALSERLEQMQQLNTDIFEGDLFGEQEWFDDDFGSMPKSKSIIQVPVRSQEAPVRTPPAPGTPEPSRLDLTRITQEPFYAVPHNRRDVKALVDKSVRVFHEKTILGERTASLSPPEDIMGEDTQGSDIESASRKSYKRLVFDLVGEAYQDITSEQEQAEQLPWTKTKRRPRKYFFDRPPRELPDIAQVVEDRALFVTGLTGRPKPDPAMNRFGKKKKDHVDEILTLELREEEQEWVNYDDDELAVKMQLTEAIFDSLLMDTAMALNRIQDRQKARMAPTEEPEIEF